MTDLIPAPRLVESPEDRMRAATAVRLPVHGVCPLGHTPDQHRHLAGLEADLRSQNRAVLELTAENTRLRAELGAAQELIAVVDDVTEQLDRARARYATRQGG